MNVQRQTIYGKKIRTSNKQVEEIINLWNEVLKLNIEGELYAVYHNYESNHLGKYDLLIGSSNKHDMDSVDLPEGKYECIEIQNPTPEKVGKEWQKIWKNQNLESKRSYLVDFEYYRLKGPVSIYLGLK